MSAWFCPIHIILITIFQQIKYRVSHSITQTYQNSTMLQGTPRSYILSYHLILSTKKRVALVRKTLNDD
jgi:hypothetical protein